jgi:hypothetical protein
MASLPFAEKGGEFAKDGVLSSAQNRGRTSYQNTSLARHSQLTGGKGWCPDPVHHKHIARKWTKNLPNTHLEYSKDIQNFPSQFN